MTRSTASPTAEIRRAALGKPRKTGGGWRKCAWPRQGPTMAAEARSARRDRLFGREGRRGQPWGPPSSSRSRLLSGAVALGFRGRQQSGGHVLAEASAQRTMLRFKVVEGDVAMRVAKRDQRRLELFADAARRPYARRVRRNVHPSARHPRRSRGKARQHEREGKKGRVFAISC